MNAIKYFDFGYNKQLNKNVVKQPSGFSFDSVSYTDYGDIGEEISLNSNISNWGSNVRIIVKYTNPDIKDNVITISKKGEDPYFETYAPRENCSLTLNSFSDLYVVFTKANNLETDPQDKVVFKVGRIYDDFRISFDTNGDNYNVFLVFETLYLSINDYGQFEDPPTCFAPYGYVKFNRFN